MVWFVVIENLFLIRDSLIELSLLLPHLDSAWQPNLCSESHPGPNCFKRLAELAFFGTLFVVSFRHFTLSLRALPPPLPCHHTLSLFLLSLPGSDINGGMKG